jgi:hypothetical protein
MLTPKSDIVVVEATPAPPDHSAPSTFATRRAERDRRRAAGEQVDVPLRQHGFDAVTPNFTVTHVRG